MEHLVIGTAGHVDHGKTKLVKALTGHDTDRLKEEKERGMTIELGFAPLLLGEHTLSIVDVPGHEKLVKTMVSGASGMDLGLLIVAADDGIMPQTIEHLHVLSLLHIPSIIVVVTKTDLVTPSQLRATLTDITEYLLDTSYPDAPICPVSSLTGDGILELKVLLQEKVSTRMPRNYQELFMMPIDRVFTMKGHGTVVTGTILGGKIQEEDAIWILGDHPKIITKVKSLQVHGESVQKVGAGRRCAMNLSKVEKATVRRGSVIIKPHTIEPTWKLDAVLYNRSNDKPLKHNQRVRIHIGTTEVIGKMRIIGSDTIECGKKGYGRITTEKPILAPTKSPFIIRSLTPIATIGGGIVLRHHARNLPRLKPDTLSYYKLFESDNLPEQVRYILSSKRGLWDLDAIHHELLVNRQAIWQAISLLSKGNKVVKIGGKHYINHDTYIDYCKTLLEGIKAYYEGNTYQVHMSKEALRTRYFPFIPQPLFQDFLIACRKKLKELTLTGPLVAYNYEERVASLLKRPEVKGMEEYLLKAGMELKDSSALEELGYGVTTIHHVTLFLIDMGRIRCIAEKYFIHESAYKDFLALITRLFSNKEKLTVIEARDALGIGRKRTIHLLEYLDQQGITKRIQDFRILSQ